MYNGLLKSFNGCCHVDRSTVLHFDAQTATIFATIEDLIKVYQHLLTFDSVYLYEQIITSLPLHHLKRNIIVFPLHSTGQTVHSARIAALRADKPILIDTTKNLVLVIETHHFTAAVTLQLRIDAASHWGKFAGTDAPPFPVDSAGRSGNVSANASSTLLRPE